MGLLDPPAASRADVAARAVGGALLRDNFARADGALGSPAVGGAWTNVGADALTIDAGEMTLAGTGVNNGYAACTVAAKPAFVVARCRFTDAANSGTATILVTGGTSFDPLNLGVHFVARRTTAVLQVRVAGGSFVDLKSWGYDAIPAGQPFTFGVWMQGDWVYALGPDGTWRVFQDARLAATSGRVVALQCNRDGTGQATARWQAVSATSDPGQDLPYVTGPMMARLLSTLFDDSTNLVARAGTDNQVKIGQTALGYAGVSIGRAADAQRIVGLPGSAKTLIVPDTLYLSENVDTYVARTAQGVVTSSGSIAATGGAWNTGHLILGAYHLWVDASGRLRSKSGAPTGDTDGVVVGTQS
jgi:hypothetical protein